jgi:peptide deformylase
MATETITRLPILVAPHPSLKARARPVTPADADTVRDLVPRMFAAMYEAPGIGLAAPQVAASKDIAVREEGCLSLPGQYADVERPAAVTVRYEDEAGVKHQIEADGLLAACLQHELDHLDGVLFVDHLSALKRNMILRRLAKEQRQRRDDAGGR